MSLCVGIDLSTKRVDLAAIPLDPDIAGDPIHISISTGAHWYAELYWDIRIGIGDIERVSRRDITTVAVEKPAGRHVHPSLHEVHGIVRASIPRHVQSTSLYPVEWRQALGLVGRDKNNKAAGLARVLELYPSCHDWDEHQLDALGIAHAWRTIQWNATAA